ncbi:hypothetical protein [Pseudomonas sp. MBLB4136]|uniref:hypothetical protein n=1 Tax=Pseudomonas sp. MBLB4136 TaxID=3451558 RepID=UPI003F74BD8C
MNTSSLFFGGVFFAADGKRFSCFQENRGYPRLDPLDKSDNRSVNSRLIRNHRESKCFAWQFARDCLLGLDRNNSSQWVNHLLYSRSCTAPANRIKDHHTGKT